MMGSFAARMRRAVPAAGRTLRRAVLVVLIPVAAALLLRTFVIDAIAVSSDSMETTLLPGDHVFVNKLVYGTRFPLRLPFSQAAAQFFRLPGLRSVKRGDVVVFEFPRSDQAAENGAVYFVKRCVGIGGDTVAVQNGRIIVNGMALDIPGSGWGDRVRESGAGRDDCGPFVVPQRGDFIQLDAKNISSWAPLIRLEGHHVERNALEGILIDGKPAYAYRIENSYLFVVGDNRDHSYDSRWWGFLPENDVLGRATMIYWSADDASSIRWKRIGRMVE